MEKNLASKAIAFRRGKGTIMSNNKYKKGISLVEKTYELSEYLQKPLPQEKFAYLLQQSGKERIILSPQRVKSYSFQGIQLDALRGYHPLFGKKNAEGVSYHLYLDVPMALCLFYKEEPQAISGFYSPPRILRGLTSSGRPAVELA